MVNAYMTGQAVAHLKKQYLVSDGRLAALKVVKRFAGYAGRASPMHRILLPHLLGHFHMVMSAGFSPFTGSCRLTFLGSST